MPANDPGSGDLSRLLNPLSTIHTWVNDGAGGVHQASFSVDPDQLPVLRQGLQQAQDKLIALRSDAFELLGIPAPGNDEVSRRAVERFARQVDGPDGTLLKAVDDGTRRLQDIIDQIDALTKTYQQADDDSRM
ncbi:hypothetical protein [Streptoalloteichus hindustanus]|uniref:PE family protein n=1 Tax=Streptoalloteichus hindustanus TaxID=2017 RepID=A0A1M5PHE5_STRHI|nr:hypothetical protein [Streptoalloteichus hindustanus]SHH01150.1 hypothetical protein SAMN05444320_11862 [Streptoalloteichus hindustanus]